VAEDACLTYSIGFRAPAAEELAHAFLMHLQDTVTLDGRYADPDLRLQRHPGEIGRAMLDQIEAMITRVKWTRRDIAEFAGRYLSEPKPNVFFDPPDAPLSRVEFRRAARRQGIALDPRSRLLFTSSRFYLNGEVFEIDPAGVAALRQLADSRRLPAPLPAPLLDQFYDWYTAGWLEIPRP